MLVLYPSSCNVWKGPNSTSFKWNQEILLVTNTKCCWLEIQKGWWSKIQKASGQKYNTLLVTKTNKLQLWGIRHFLWNLKSMWLPKPAITWLNAEVVNRLSPRQTSSFSFILNILFFTRHSALLLKQVNVTWTHILNIDVNGEKLNLCWKWFMFQKASCPAGLINHYVLQKWSGGAIRFWILCKKCQLAVKTLHRDDQQFFRGKMRTDEKWKKM